MAIQKTEAIVLRTQLFRSSSLIVTFFTRDFGKIQGLVKGVRQEGQTRASAYELFTRLEILFYEKIRSNLHLISDGFTLESYEGIRSRLDTIAYASYFSELVSELTEVHDPHDKIYELLDFSYRYLSSVSPVSLCRLFEVKLLAEIGWLPHLDSCISCSKSGFERGYFSIRQGGIYCSDCSPEIPDARELAPAVLSLMRFYANHDLEEGLRQHPAKSVVQDFESLMSRFILDRHTKPFKSRRFLEKIKPVLSPTFSPSS